MDIAQVAIGNIVGLIAFALLVATAMKTYQIANAMSEIKDQLAALKRDIHPAYATEAPTEIRHGLSGEEMLRAVSLELERESPSAPAEPPAISPSTDLHQ